MLRCELCGHENRDGAKFCENCAAPLVAPATPHEVRKTVTVVFCDVAGSTAMGEALDPESVRRVMERFFDAMRAAIEHHGGAVEKFIGDAVMAVFGVPQVHEDDALRAVRAASEMRAALEALNPELDRDHGMTLACRIGVNTGDVVAGVGNQKIVTGDAVNVAARLEQAASPRRDPPGRTDLLARPRCRARRAGRGSVHEGQGRRRSGAPIDRGDARCARVRTTPRRPDRRPRARALPPQGRLRPDGHRPVMPALHRARRRRCRQVPAPRGVRRRRRRSRDGPSWVAACRTARGSRSIRWPRR